MTKRNWPMLILAAVVAFALGLALARAFQVAILASMPPPSSGPALQRAAQSDGPAAPPALPTPRATEQPSGGSATSPSSSSPDGKALFQKACATCHGIGSGDRIGPDLAGVSARRDRSWLIKAITVPDRMRLERDPITIALYDKFNRIDMPNLGLSEADALALIAYIDGATRANDDAK